MPAGRDFERLNAVIAGERDDAEILHVSGDDVGFACRSRRDAALQTVPGIKRGGFADLRGRSIADVRFRVR